MTKKDESIATLLANAERSVKAYEALALGDPFAAALEAAVLAVLDLADPARVAIFPRFVRASADDISMFEFHESSWTRERYPERCADLHCECFDVDPKLAAFLRSGPVRDRVVAAGVSYSATVARPAAEVADEFEARYARLIASQLTLADRETFEPHASVLATHEPALSARIATCSERHNEYLRTETARLAREAADAEAIIEAEAQRRRDVVREFFANRSGQRFFLRTRLFSGAGLSQSVRGAGLRDQEDGEFVQLPTIDELELVMKRAIAAETVPA